MNDMNNWKRAITLAVCCGICLTVAPSGSADYIWETALKGRVGMRLGGFPQE